MPDIGPCDRGRLSRNSTPGGIGGPLDGFRSPASKGKVASLVKGWWTTDAQLRQEVLEAVPRLERHPFAEFDAPSAPGAYLIFIASQRLLQMHRLGSTAALVRGELLAYCGSSQRGLRGRLGRYRQSLRGVIEPGELYVSVLPTGSAPSALFIESVVVESWSPVLNSTSFGSKVPGKNRANQKLGMLEALWAGRSWARDPTALERARAQIQLVMRICRVPDDAPRWPALIAPAQSNEPDAQRAARGDLRMVIGGGR